MSVSDHVIKFEQLHQIAKSHKWTSWMECWPTGYYIIKEIVPSSYCQYN